MKKLECTTTTTTTNYGNSKTTTTHSTTCTTTSLNIKKGSTSRKRARIRYPSNTHACIAIPSSGGSTSSSGGAVVLGGIGYKFRKYFRGYGYFDGVVTEIRKDAADRKDRRCVYTDGDVEDLSLEELRVLYPKSVSTLANSTTKLIKASPSSQPCKEIRSSNNRNKRSSTAKRRADAEIHIAIQCNDIPIDEAAERTIYPTATCTTSTNASGSANDRGDMVQQQQEEVLESESEEDLWLEKVATLLANGGKTGGGNPSGNNNGTMTSFKRDRNTRIDSGAVTPSNRPASVSSYGSSLQPLAPPLPSTPSAITSTRPLATQGAVTSLASLKAGTRFGTNVSHMKDPKRRVGAVLLDEKGWVEACIDDEMIRDRAKNFLLLSSATTGDASRITVPKGCNSSRTSRSSRLQAVETEGIKRRMSPSFQKQDVCNNNANISRASSNHPKRDSYNTKDVKPRIEVLQASNKACNKESNKLSNFFYWNCHYCTSFNSFLKVQCNICQQHKSSQSVLSPLLQKVKEAVTSNTNATDAYQSLSFTLRQGIDKKMLQFFYGVILVGSSSCTSVPMVLDKIVSLDDYFNWSCGYCTLVNSYKKTRCTSCLNAKSYLSECSTMLHLALDIAKKHSSVKQACESISFYHKPALPKVVLEYLVTCSAIVVGKNKNDVGRRCMRAKTPGKQHCILHCDVLDHQEKENLQKEGHCGSASSATSFDVRRSSFTSDKTNEESSSSVSSTSNHNCSNTSTNNDSNIPNLLSTLYTFLSTQIPSKHYNRKQYQIQSLEDAITSHHPNSTPFPLGMEVRRFFSKHGFHDGRIIHIRRCVIFDDALQTHRPVLVYRIKYIDGDEEDFLNHHIVSLRQMYDLRHVQSTALPLCQIVPKTIYECITASSSTSSSATATTTSNNQVSPSTTNKTWIQVISNHTPAGIPNKKEGGLVKVNLYKQGTTTNPLLRMNLNVTDLQLSIIRKYPLEKELIDLELHQNKLHQFDSSLMNSPVLEWPRTKLVAQQPPLNNNDSVDVSTSSTSTPSTTTATTSKDSNKIMIHNGLWLTNTKTTTTKIPPSVPITDNHDIRPGVTSEIWDPSSTSPFLLWDPYSNIVCEICKSGSDEHQMLLCDKCHKGYHMYCLRPIVVNIPAHDWICAKCSSSPNHKQTFQEMIFEFYRQPKIVMQFLNFTTYKTPSDFRWFHEEELALFDPTISSSATNRKNILFKKVTKSRSTTKYKSLYFSYSYSSNEWVLPVPLVDVSLYTTSVMTIVAAMKYCGMERYSEELVYAEERMKQMNDCKLDSVEPMNKRSLEIFREFKYNLSRGAFPPIKIVYDEKVGFTVEALAKIPRHTLIAEYVGEVTTVEKSETSSSGSDSLMMLLDTGNPKTSLIIDPSTVGNIARFLSGVNNRSYSSKRKANVRTRRFELDGQSRVVLFTSKTVEVGDKLHYDYNSGLQDKQVEDWAKNGFYDTSNFI